ncbi:MAG: tRNA (adenosine(37)-N6)-dimethylallyltransferase MiaA [Candidatus Omnitrophica bacterium]|nr:tRNA (adenosine(37)-N6)-dimethylallyltransferase MiaA [Candidatus Omnitrophota bacterium]
MALLVFLVGPTAVGKTALALALAPLIDAQIVSCDSMQIYSGMDIATSKPTIAEREIVKHHMLDVVSPRCEYSVADYRRDALKIIEGIINNGRIPLIVGGSGLYFKALLDGIFNGPSKDTALRESLYKEASERGNEFLYERLKKIDPATAEKIHSHDLRRIIRALEVYYLTGMPISVLRRHTTGLFSHYKTVIYGLIRPKKELYQIIDERVEMMFARGLLPEIERLKNIKITPIAQQCLGYREITAFLEGKITLDEAKELLKRHTRQFAKRQLTWFLRDKRIKWINLDNSVDINTLAKELANEIKQFSHLTI